MTNLINLEDHPINQVVYQVSNVSVKLPATFLIKHDDDAPPKKEEQQKESENSSSIISVEGVLMICFKDKIKTPFLRWTCLKQKSPCSSPRSRNDDNHFSKLISVSIDPNKIKCDDYYVAVETNVEDVKCFYLKPSTISSTTWTEEEDVETENVQKHILTSMTIIEKDGNKKRPLHFSSEDQVQELIEKMREFMSIKASSSSDLYLVRNLQVAELDQKLSEMNLTKRRKKSRSGESNKYSNRFLNSLSSESVWNFVSDLQKDPYTKTLSTFSRIAEKMIYEPIGDLMYDDDEVKRYFGGEINTTNSNLAATSNFYEIQDEADVEDYRVIVSKDERPIVWDQIDTRKDMNSLRKTSQFSHSDLVAYQSKNGDGSVNIIKSDDETGQSLLNHLFECGGMHHELRKDLWPYLLQVYDFGMTEHEKGDRKMENLEKYTSLKRQWQTITEDQESRFKCFRERKSLIEKDVLRTDRDQKFYENEPITNHFGDGLNFNGGALPTTSPQGDSGEETEEENLTTLRSILLSYVMYNFDLGYVQGMSDLLSPILYVVRDECESFWCFVRFMEKVGANFCLEQSGIKGQFQQLCEIQKVVDYPFHTYLLDKGCSNFYFAFRSLLIWFKREFTFDDILSLWEYLWIQGHPGLTNEFRGGRNFHLLIFITLLQCERTIITENEFQQSEILKHMNDLSGYNDLNLLLSKAESLYLKLKQLNFVNEKVCDILSTVE